MLLAELLAQLLRPVYGQAVVCPVPWVKADDIVDVYKRQVLPVLRYSSVPGVGICCSVSIRAILVGPFPARQRLYICLLYTSRCV